MAERPGALDAHHHGPAVPQSVLLRITDNGDANSGAQIQIADGGPLIDQRAVVDPSFLELVRLGAKSADDPNIISTLEVIDSTLKYETQNGPFWHRSSYDGYDEKRDGTQWEPVDPGSRETIGRGWPLLTGVSQGEKRRVPKGPRRASMPCKSACSESRIGNGRTRGFST